MTRKKNGFWLFVFSFLPGAGEMYMGFMKQGTTLMGSFFLLVFLASWLNIGPLLFVLPVLWCYGFFHAHNLRNMPDDEFYAVEDEYLFHLDQILPKKDTMDKKSRNVLAIVLIVIGGALLWNNFGAVVRWILPAYIREWYWRIGRMVPQVIVAVLFIAVGIWLIRGKKQELDEQEYWEDSKKENRDDWDQKKKGGDSL